MTTPRSVLWPVILLALVGGGVIVGRPYVRGLSFVVRAADLRGVLRAFADLDAEAIGERELHIPTTAGSLRARSYEPGRKFRRTSLLVGGLHPGGYDDPRLVAFARQLAASGMAVVTPDIPELSQFVITPALTDSIEQSAVFLAADPRLAPDGRLGLMGVSFSGGLSLVAAGRPSLRGRVAYVFSFGGHDDLSRVLRYLCTGGVRGGVRPPHDYGVAVVLLGTADRLVPGDQVKTLRDAARRFLRASYLTRVDGPAADREFAALRAMVATLPEPSATLVQYMNQRDVAHLGPLLLPYIGFYGDAAALSVSRSPKTTAPVFLLHGADDNVIPADESEYLADQLRGSAPVRLLVTNVLSHAEADRPWHVRDLLQLGAFWDDLLAR